MAVPDQPIPYIPLGMVAKITREIGANEIASEDGRLRSFVQANVQNRDLGSFVQEIEEKLKTVDWEGMTYKMSGEYENQRRFTATMKVVFPMVLLIIFVLLFLVYRSGTEAAHVMLAIPFALSGGVLLQKLLGYEFNGAVWVGYRDAHGVSELRWQGDAPIVRHYGRADGLRHEQATFVRADA